MLAVAAVSQSSHDPLSGLEVGERPEPEVPEGWTTVELRAATLNHHDLWSLQGVGLPADRLPMILGCDGAGLDAEGNEVVVHALVGDHNWRGDETFDPKRSILSERHPGTFAQRVAVPKRNLVPKPASLSFEEAACLPTAWLTVLHADHGAALPPDLRFPLEARCWCRAPVEAWPLRSSRSARRWACACGSPRATRPRVPPPSTNWAPMPTSSGARLPHKVDAVMETVGAATWGHSIRSLRPGGTVVVCGATSGDPSPAEMTRIFFLQLSVIGSTMGTRDELERLLSFLDVTGVRPIVDASYPLADAAGAFAKLHEGDVFGKLALTMG